MVFRIWLLCVRRFFVFFFFFKQKTAYEMCGRDWSSDVCSSDLTLSLQSPTSPQVAFATSPTAKAAPAMIDSGTQPDHNLLLSSTPASPATSSVLPPVVTAEPATEKPSRLVDFGTQPDYDLEPDYNSPETHTKDIGPDAGERDQLLSVSSRTSSTVSSHVVNRADNNEPTDSDFSDSGSLPLYSLYPFSCLSVCPCAHVLFVAVSDRVPTRSFYQELSATRTSLLSDSESPAIYLTYVNVPWSLSVRKEVFSPNETLTNSMAIDLIFYQIVRDVLSQPCVRVPDLGRTEVQKLLGKSVGLCLMIAVSFADCFNVSICNSSQVKLL